MRPLTFAISSLVLVSLASCDDGTSDGGASDVPARPQPISPAAPLDLVYEAPRSLGALEGSAPDSDSQNAYSDEVTNFYGLSVDDAGNVNWFIEYVSRTPGQSTKGRFFRGTGPLTAGPTTKEVPNVDKLDPERFAYGTNILWKYVIGPMNDYEFSGDRPATFPGVTAYPPRCYGYVWPEGYAVLGEQRVRGLQVASWRTDGTRTAGRDLPLRTDGQPYQYSTYGVDIAPIDRNGNAAAVWIDGDDIHVESLDGSLKASKPHGHPPPNLPYLTSARATRDRSALLLLITIGETGDPTKNTVETMRFDLASRTFTSLSRASDINQLSANASPGSKSVSVDDDGSIYYSRNSPSDGSQPKNADLHRISGTTDTVVAPRYLKEDDNTVDYVYAASGTVYVGVHGWLYKLRR